MWRQGAGLSAPPPKTVGYTPDDEEYESVNLDIIEIYRQLGEFENAKALLEQTTRRTHFISKIEEKVDRKDSLVFLVSG